LYLYDVLGALTFYPARDSGFFLKAGLGGAFIDTEFRSGNTTVRSEYGPGLGWMAGTGYDVRVGRNVSITPAFTYWRSGTIETGFDDVISLAESKIEVFEISIGVTFH
jgi:hypothetical protein